MKKKPGIVTWAEARKQSQEDRGRITRKTKEVKKKKSPWDKGVITEITEVPPTEKFYFAPDYAKFAKDFARFEFTPVEGGYVSIPEEKDTRTEAEKFADEWADKNA